MRVLRLDLPDHPVDLHPFVTVVRGLPPEARALMLDALAGLSRGTAVVPGLLEAHGVLLDLDAESLDLLDLHEDVDAIVHPQDLPGGVGVRRVEAERALAEARADVAAAEERVERAVRALDGARDALAAARDATAGELVDPLAEQRADVERHELATADADRAVEEAIVAEQLAAAAVVDAEAAVEAARVVRTEATRALSVAAAALEAATARRDPMAAAAVEAARTRLTDADAIVAAMRAAEEEGRVPEEPPDEPLPSDDDIAALQAARVEAEAAALALDTVDPSPVRLALEQLRAGGAIEPVPDPRAIELAEQLSDVEADLAIVTAADDIDDDLEGGHVRHEAQVRLAAAEAAVASAEAALRPPSPDPADVQVLEDAHSAVQAARDDLERPLRRRGAARRLADAQAQEAAALERLGYETFTDYLMGFGVGRRGDPAASDRLDAARAELLAASVAARDFDAAVAGELRRAELLDRRRELRAAAVELLGTEPDDDVVAVLRQRRVPATETGGHLARLRAALDATGVALEGEDMPEATLLDLASVWLAEQDRALVERAALEQRVSDLDAQVSEASRRRAVAAEAEEEAAAGRRTRLTDALAAVDEARRAIAVAEARVARHAEAERDVEARRTDLEVAAADEAQAISEIANTEAALADARIAEREAARRSREAEAAASAARARGAVATELLATLEQRLAAEVDRVPALEADLVDANAELAEARTDSARCAATLEAALAHLAAVEEENEEEPAADPEDAEWYLLARLAAQRAVSFAGSVPLVLDDALVGLGAEPTRRLLDRLERMAATVQVIVVTEDLLAAAWAESLGVDRAAVAQPL